MQGAGQRMFNLSQVLAEKEEQLQKLRNEKESESLSKCHEMEEISKKIPGLLNFKYIDVTYHPLVIHKIVFHSYSDPQIE